MANVKTPSGSSPRAGESDWVSKVASDVIARVDATKGPDAPIVCASGISPSGPVHLGNLRELMTTHLVAEELRARGRTVTHLHSWDDYDRLRKVPVGIDASFAQHIGSPIGEIPDPTGSTDSYGSYFRLPVESAAARLGMPCRWVRQSTAYRAGAYTAGMRKALRARGAIFDVLEQFRTAKPDDRPLDERRDEYWPLQVYCRTCNHDSTTVTRWDEATDVVDYTCARCGPDRFELAATPCPAKLPWKVDWPMRWAYEGVDFEPGGEDHSTPGGSFSVSSQVCKIVYDIEAPMYVGYGFVGMAGRTKISSSSGTDATPEFALRFIEPSLLRYLYIKRLPNVKFNVDFGADIWRQYDELDALARKVADGKASPAEAQILARSQVTSAGPVERAAVPVPFRLLWTAADMTAGNRAQILRIVHAHLDDPPALEDLEAAIQPRLDCAMGWVANCLPDDERLKVKAALDLEAWEALDEDLKRGLKLLVENLGGSWSLGSLTALVYNVPKLLLDLSLDVEPTAELKAYQRRFFAAIYQLVLGSDTGPRLPTLFLSLGPARVAELLGGPT